MGKKLLIALLSVTASVSCALGLAACGDNDKKDDTTENSWGTVYTVQTAYAVATDLGYTGTLEEFIATISGKDGKDGTNGKDGINGKDGVGIDTIEINPDGKLIMTLTDKTVIDLGRVQGLNGVNGKDGVDGIGVDKIEINSDGEIVVTYTDKTTKNLGKLPDCNHSYSQWANGLLPTCTSMGYDFRTCSKCGDKDYKMIEQTSHTWDDGVVLVKPTAKKTGLELYSCTVCRTAKTEVLDVLEVMSEAEWRAAVNATIMADNFTYEADSESPGSSEPIWYEKVACNLDKGLSYYFTDRVQNDGCKYKEEVYYKLNDEDKLCFNNTSYVYDDDPSNNQIYGWVVKASISDYTRCGDKPEEVKFDLDNHGYSFLESWGNCLTYEMWDELLLEDAYDLFVFDDETESYCYTDEDGMNYSFKFENGLISEFLMSYEYDGVSGYMHMVFSDYGTTKVTIPQELTVLAAEKGLTFENWYGYSEPTEVVVKSQYFGYDVTAIEEGAFSGCSGLVKITIPASVTTIGKDAFHGCFNLKDIVYNGTKEQWEAIQKGANWVQYVTDCTVHCTNGEAEPQNTLTYKFEAELTDLSNFEGNGYSGSASGEAAICRDQNNKTNASNGFWVDYMYSTGCTLTFEFNCDKTVTDATLTLRLATALVKEIMLSAEDFTVTVNGTAIRFDTLTITDNNFDQSAGVYNFQDFTVAENVNLKQGTNVVVLRVTNNKSLGGTATATAPIVDCIKVATSATLLWTPVAANLSRFGWDIKDYEGIIEK